MSETTTWYAVSKYGSDIESSEVLRETPSCLIVKSDRRWSKNGERRVHKNGYDTWFKTWAEAHAYLVERARLKWHDARQNLRDAEDEYKKALEMMP